MAFVVPVGILVLCFFGGICLLLKTPVEHFYESKELKIRVWADKHFPGIFGLAFKAIYITVIVFPLLFIGMGVGISLIFLFFEAGNQFFELIKFLIL